MIIAESGQQAPVLYKCDKGVNEAARSPEGGLDEAGRLLALSLPLLDSDR